MKDLLAILVMLCLLCEYFVSQLEDIEIKTKLSSTCYYMDFMSSFLTYYVKLLFMAEKKISIILVSLIRGKIKKEQRTTIIIRFETVVDEL